MTQYIDKDALVAEIERLEKMNHKSEYVYDSFDTEYTLKSILSFINKMEVKEVDFEKALDDYVYQEGLVNCYEIMPIAKHFFELGLRAQKGK